MAQKRGRLSAVLFGIGVGIAAQAAEGQPPPSWIAQAQRQVEASEYEVSWQTRAGSYQAPNRAQGFRTSFTKHGIRAVPRVESDSDWEWGLQWIGYGRGGDSGPLPVAELSPAKNRIDYHRGPFTEWYENRPDGLEQGFLLPVPPEEVGAGDGSDAPVHVDLALTGSLRPVISDDGQAIDFVRADGTRVLRYAGLRVTDARGSKLHSWMEGFVDESARGIRLVVDARDAIYPLTVDPLASTSAWTNESNQTTAEFGRSVGTAGDVNGDGYSDLIVGAPFYDNGQTDEGRAYVYLGSASGLPPTPAWMAESDQASARFASSVATAGDVNGDGYSDVIVGAPLYDNVQTDEGRAYVYLGSASGLAQNPVWIKEIDQGSANFGTSVACAGDVNGDGYADVVVGAYLWDNVETDEGGAFAYLGSSSGPAATPVWTTEGDQASAQYGWSVATAGDVNGDGYADVLVGAPMYDHGQTNEGRAYLYPGNASGISTTVLWVNEGNQDEAQYGYSVATAGDVLGSGYASILVGAWLYDNGQTDEGRAFLYTGGAAGPPLFALWTMESDTDGAYLGWSVGTAGDVNGDGYADILVTAPYYSISVTEGGGQARVYLGSPTGPSTSPEWLVTRLPANAAYGRSAATAGDVNGDGYADIVIGAPWDENGQTNEGIAYVYYGSPNALASQFTWSEGNQDGAQMGLAVGTAGDVNGDGYGDLLIGAPLYDNGEADEGKVFLILGSPSSPIASTWNVETNQAGSNFGAAVGTAGDVNGDGYDDVVVGAPLYDDTLADDGRAYLFLGGATGLATTPAWFTHGPTGGSQFGAAARTAGDVDGDGYADWIVGAPRSTNGQALEGRAFLFRGSSGALATGAAWAAEVDQANAGFGSSVATAGDVNGDGYADVVVGAPRFDNGQTDEGRAFLYLGSASGLAASPSWTAESNVVGGGLGAFWSFSASSAGDVNGDGYADVIVGAPGGIMGRVDVYKGQNSASGLASTPFFTVTDGDPGGEFGASVAGAGDVNGDGYADIVIGAPSYLNQDTGGIFGFALVYLGSPAGLTGGPGAASSQDGDRFGAAVAPAGDINGDGYADLVVGAPLYDSGQTSEGRASIYFGGGSKWQGIALDPRQRTSAGTRPISRGLFSDSATGFRLAALGRTPFGRGKVRLEWEVKPWGTAVNGSGTVTGLANVDTGLTGGALEEQVTGLTPNTRYHWRVRLLYDQASVPFAKRSRWLTVPWGGVNEVMLRTSVTSAGAGRSAAFVLTKVGLGVTMSWSGIASCNPSDTDHAIYEGALGNFTSHVPVTCSTSPGHSWNFTPQAGNRYFLLVPINASREGSYGLSSTGIERPQGAPACRPQLVSCP